MASLSWKTASLISVSVWEKAELLTSKRKLNRKAFMEFWVDFLQFKEKSI
jgi:hypothetical protein